MSLRLRRALVYLALGYLVVSVVVMLWLAGSALLTHGQWKEFQASLHATAPTPVAARALQEDIKTLQRQGDEALGRLTRLISIQRSRFPVAGKLAGLARTLPPRTWLTGLAGDRAQRTVRIQAAYLINPEAPSDLPAKSWMDALKTDPAFGAGLTRLTLESSSQKVQGEADLYLFELVAEWK